MFLDFDGVLHGRYSEDISNVGLEAFYKNDSSGIRDSIIKGDFFHPNKIEMIYNALLPYTVDIVVSSTWRRNFSVEELKCFLGRLGDYVIGVTGEANRLAEMNQRHAEINAYIDNHDLLKEPFLIIDDTKLPNFFVCGRQVLVVSDTGFTESSEKELINILEDVNAVPAGYYDRLLKGATNN